MMNNELTGMTLKQFYNGLWEDQKARLILVEYKDRFLKLQEAGKYFKEGN